MLATAFARVAIVMMDTRPPDLGRFGAGGAANFSLNNLTITDLTHHLNEAYARAHGYDLLFLQLSSAGCEHAVWGARHPSYCKLAALAEALSPSRGYDYVVYVDSDAFVRNTSVPLAQLLVKYSSGATAAELERSLAFFGWDLPYSLGPNAGVLVLRNCAETRALLRVWWHVFAGRQSLQHSYEQHTLHGLVLHLHRWRQQIRTLRLRTMDASYPDDVVHLDHNAGTKTRLWTMYAAIAENAVAARSFDRGATGLDAAALEALRGPHKGLKRSVRVRAARAAIRAAQALSVVTAGGTASRSLTVRFNATSAAALLLRPLSLDNGPSLARRSTALVGMPLILTNCSRTRLLGDLQLWLVNRTAAGSPSPPLPALATQRLRLQHHPHLCLALGASRSTRQPYASLAQLDHCRPGPGQPRAGGAASARVRMRTGLRYDESTRRLHTAAPLSVLRRSLPGLGVGGAGNGSSSRRNRSAAGGAPRCGFWPSCAGMDSVLPKPCWAELQTTPRACGASEKALLNWRYVRERTVFEVGPAGPVPSGASGKERGGKDKLCLSTWRGQLAEGSAATFVGCPRESDARRTKAHKPRWQAADSTSQWQLVATRAPHGKPPSRGPRGRPAPVPVHIRPSAAPHLCLSAPSLSLMRGESLTADESLELRKSSAVWRRADEPVDAAAATRQAEREAYDKQQQQWRKRGGDHGGLIGKGKVWKKRSDNVHTYKQARGG